jgi:Spy/CpxP family protein refolding chaperone
MDNTNKNKWQVRGAVLGIFLLGFLAGLLTLNFYHKWSDNEPRQMNNRTGLEQTFERLQLTEEQQSQVRGIFDEARNQMREMRKESIGRRRELRRQTDERLQKVLNSEQWQQFQQIRNESQRGVARSKG